MNENRDGWRIERPLGPDGILVITHDHNAPVAAYVEPDTDGNRSATCTQCGERLPLELEATR